jgi:Tfp pilus assembly PilM family ATPase/Tfp pilus assembly protein PilN
LDLGAVTVRAVEWAFGSSDGSVRVLKRGSAPLPHGIWNDLGAQRETLSAAILQALSAAGIASRTVVACLPRRLVTLRLVRLPHAAPDEMRGMVAFEAQQVILYSLEEVILSYHVLPVPIGKAGTDADMEPVLLAAARRTLIGDVMAAFDRAGIELQQLSVSALALAEHGRTSSEPTALINVEAGELEIAVVADGQPLFTRAASLDIQSASPEVAVRRALEETVRSLTAFQNEFRNIPLAEIKLAGAGSATAIAGTLEQALKETLDLPVNPLVTGTLKMQDPELRAYACAVGMGFQTRPDSIAPINLVPGERAEMRAQKVKGQRQTIALVAAVLVAMGGVWAFARNLDQQSKARQDQLAWNNKLSTLDDRLKKRQKQYDAVAALGTDLVKGLDRNHPAVDVLVALNAAMPTSKDIWLTQLSLNRGGSLTLRGDAKSALMATDLVIALQGSGAFTNVQLNYLGDAPESDLNGGVTTAADSGTSAGGGSAALPGMAATAAPSSTSPATTASAAPVTAGTRGRAPGGPGGTATVIAASAPPGARAARPGGPTVAAVTGASRRPVSSAPPGAPPPGGDSGSGPVPAISTPPGGIQKRPKAAVPATTAPKPAGTLTSFVIICRINPQAHDLTASVTAAKR